MCRDTGSGATAINYNFVFRDLTQIRWDGGQSNTIRLVALALESLHDGKASGLQKESDFITSKDALERMKLDSTETQAMKVTRELKTVKGSDNPQ